MSKPAFTWGVAIPLLGTSGENFCWHILPVGLLANRVLLTGCFCLWNALCTSSALKRYIWYWISLLSRPISPGVNAVDLQEGSLCFILSTLVRHSPFLHAQIMYFLEIPFPVQSAGPWSHFSHMGLQGEKNPQFLWTWASAFLKSSQSIHLVFLCESEYLKGV